MNDFIETPSGLILSKDTAEDYYRKFIRPKAIDLFAGCGGMSCGLIRGGFEVVAALDISPIAAITYMYNLGNYPCKFHFVSDTDSAGMERELQKIIKHSSKNGIASIPASGSGFINHEPPGTPGVGHFFLGDIRKLSGQDILKPLGMERGEIDMIAGGPPCQGFSTSGKRDVMDPRNSLVFDFARIVCEVQPKTIIFENVPGIIDMVTPEGVPVMDAFCRVLEDGGFGGFDSFLKSIETQTGNVGLLRGKKKGEKGETTKKTKRQAQRSLF